MLAVPDFFLRWQDLLGPLTAALAVILLVVAAYGDIRTRRIPNWLVIAVAILGVTRLFVFGDQIAAIYTVTVALLVLFVTFLLFTRRLMGGGDVKLLAATVLLVGYHAVFMFLAIMSICGGLLAVAIFLWLLSVNTKRQPSVPYGVAIAAGAIVTLFLQTSMIG